jgi:hypothetical protein
MANRTDNFTRTDSSTALGTPSDAGSDWVAGRGTWGISSNKGYLVSDGGADNVNVAYLESSLADVEVQVTISGLGANFDVALCGRVEGADDYILLVCRGGGNIVELYKKVSAGNFVSLDTDSGTPLASVMKLVMNGSTLEGWVDGVIRVSASDSHNSTATSHGISQYTAVHATEIRYDDFSITSLAAAGGTGGNLLLLGVG